MQILEKPRLITEKEDVHLLRTFLISTKPNKSLWRISRETGHDVVKGFIGKDFYAVPERIFKPIEQGRGGHVSGSSYEDEMAQIKKHSHGKIERLFGPYYYDDSPKDYWYDAEVRLSGSKTAAAIIENGSKTWTPFAVSAHVWPKEGDDDNMTDWEPMGLALVIEPAYGKQSVISKMCSGSKLQCGTSLTAAIENIDYNMLPEVLSSFISKTTDNSIMSTQQLQSTPVQTDSTIVKTNDIIQTPTNPLNIPQEIKKDENITLTKEEYDTVQKQLKEQNELREQVAQLKKERNTNVLSGIFGSIEDEQKRTEIIDKYLDKDVNLVNQAINDYKNHIVPSLIANGQTVKEGKPEEKSKTASVKSLKPEPKISKEESKVASITSEPTASDFRSILGL